ncbi:BCCT family transporter [Kushneria aurantia]|uniref:BCCT family transporter n=1 Tax=Kushneria aurantia TaxID=504092 RepID=A0ABV6G7S7_9GAMM|nr:choline BCCT transporter BetT [Kushneria aurantia]
MKEEAEKPQKAGINPPVFYPSAAVILALVLFGGIFPSTAGAVFNSVQSWIISTFGWLYLLSMGVFLVFILIMAFSRFGQFKLGPDHSEPEFSYSSWFAMLFSAGMGIGLMFYGVAEPVTHYANPPQAQGSTEMAARMAMESTFFHWGFHAWGVYAVVALALAYFGFRHGLPLRISSALYPLIGKRIYGPIGHTVDVFAVFGTMFGVATSLGLGVSQVNAGINFLFGIPENTLVQFILIAIVTGLATMSVILGLDGGIRRISEWNLWLALALLIFVFVAGPTLFILQTLPQNIGAYLSSVVNKTFNMFAYTGGEDTDGFLSGWTLFYWAWWIAWSPFVGMFIARVSRGRTIREFVLGVLFVPCGVTFVWLTVFGDSALYQILNNVSPQLVEQVQNNSATALFHFLNSMPLSLITSLIATVLVITFFVTSSDSGSLVIDMLTAKDGEESPTWQRIFWAVSEGVVAFILLLAGGLGALQAASLISALPFALILMVVCLGVYKALRVELLKQDSMRHMMNTPGNVSRVGAGGSARSDYWQNRLQTLVSSPRRQQVNNFLHETVAPALKEVSEEFKKQQLDTRITEEDDRCYLRVGHGDEIDFVYGIRVRPYAAPSFTLNSVRRNTSNDKRSHYRAEVFLREGGQQYNVMGYAKQQVIGDVLDQYEKHLHFLHLLR